MDLAARLLVISESRPELEALASELATAAEAAWTRCGGREGYGWPSLVRLFVMPLAEPLHLDGAPAARLRSGMLAQTHLLLIERALDDVRDERSDPTLLFTLAWLSRGVVSESPIGDDVPSVSPPGLRLGPLDGWRRAEGLVSAAGAIVGDRHRAWVEAYRALVSLTVLMDDQEDALNDIFAGRETAVTRVVRDARWSATDIIASIGIADQLKGHRVTLCRQIVAVEARYPLMAAIATAACPASMREAAALASTG